MIFILVIKSEVVVKELLNFQGALPLFFSSVRPSENIMREFVRNVTHALVLLAESCSEFKMEKLCRRKRNFASVRIIFP